MKTTDQFAARMVGCIAGLLLYVALSLLAGTLFGCASAAPDGSLRAINKQVAYEQLRECQTYYLFRRNKLLYPNPKDICNAVYQAANRGKVVLNWRK